VLCDVGDVVRYVVCRLKWSVACVVCCGIWRGVVCGVGMYLVWCSILCCVVWYVVWFDVVWYVVLCDVARCGDVCVGGHTVKTD
jgi:hypothetical protein